MTGDRRRVAHIVPAMFIGGVEVAIARSQQSLNEAIDYRVYYVKSRGSIDCGQRHVLRLLWSCLTGSWRPNVVVTSLWWSHPFGAILRVFGATWIAFFHNCGFTGRVQRSILLSAWRRADCRLSDSEATGSFYSEHAQEKNYRIIPYIFAEEPAAADWLSRKYDVVWVGRDVAAKRADLAASFMTELAGRVPGGRLCLIASGQMPDELAGLDLGPGWSIDRHVSLAGPEVRKLLADARFFLLTSDFEGMSMVTVEAIFAGCVPVVRLVGELENYIGDAHELVIDGDKGADLTAAARKVVARWKDSAFAADALHPIRARLAAYSTYEQEFLSAVTSPARGAGR